MGIFYGELLPRVGVWCRRGVLEGILDVMDPWPALSSKYPHRIEAELTEVRLSVDEVLFGDGADDGSFVRGDGFEWVSETCSPAQLHLDEDERSAPAHDEVQLAVAGTVVAFNEFVTLPDQVAERELLSPRAGSPIIQAPTPA